MNMESPTPQTENQQPIASNVTQVSAAVTPTIVNPKTTMNNSRIATPELNGHVLDVLSEGAHRNGAASEHAQLPCVDSGATSAGAQVTGLPVMELGKAFVIQALPTPGISCSFAPADSTQVAAIPSDAATESPEYGLMANEATQLAPLAAGEVDVDDEAFGSMLRSKSTYTVLRAQIPIPEMNERFVIATAHSGDADGLEKVRSHHTSVFLRSHGGHLSVLQHIEANISRHVRGVKKHVKEISHSLGSTRRDHDIFRRHEPWSAFDVVRAVIYGILMLVCIGAGTNTLAQTMVASAVPGFEHYGRDLLFSFLVIAFPIVVECFVQRTFTETGKRIMLAVLCVLAVGSFAIWVWAFSQTFQIGGTSASAIANDLARTLSGDGAQSINTLTIFQILSEVLVASIIAIALEHLFASHRLSERFTNPQFAKTQKDLAGWQKVLREEEELLGHARGRIIEIEHGLKEFVEEACAIYTAHRTTVLQHQALISRLTK